MRPSRTRLLRALAAFLALPGIVAVAIPLLLATPAIRARVPFRPLALIPLIAGLVLLVWCARVFFRDGRGTLAPWDPPQQLVVAGPYRFTRNPMYIAVTFILLGWAAGFASWGLLGYALVVLVAFDLRVRLHEEPWLVEKHRQAWQRYAAATPRWVFRTWQARVATAVAVLVFLALGGLVFEAYADAEASRQYAAPGTFVDAGGRRVHLLCIGAGEPTVLFEPSGWGNAASAEMARARIATRARVCSYDRPGMGWSDPGPSVLTPADLARDLAVLQDRAKLGSPLVLVASSIGGITAETFARTYPERIAGLVLLDPATSELLDTAGGRLPRLRAATCAVAAAARFGLVRLADPFGLAHADSDAARRDAAITYGARPWGSACAVMRGLAAGAASLRELPPLDRDLPVRVLSASEDDDLFPGATRLAPEVLRARVPSQQRFARLSARGTWTVLPKSSHLLADDQPDAVADTVIGLLDELDPARRTGEWAPSVSRRE